MKVLHHVIDDSPPLQRVDEVLSGWRSLPWLQLIPHSVGQHLSDLPVDVNLKFSNDRGKNWGIFLSEYTWYLFGKSLINPNGHIFINNIWLRRPLHSTHLNIMDRYCLEKAINVLFLLTLRRWLWIICLSSETLSGGRDILAGDSLLSLTSKFQFPCRWHVNNTNPRRFDQRRRWGRNDAGHENDAASKSTLPND